MTTTSGTADRYPQCATCPLPETLLRLGEPDAATAEMLLCHKVATPAMQAAGVRCPAAHQLGLDQPPEPGDDDSRTTPPVEPQPSLAPSDIAKLLTDHNQAAVRLGQRLRRARLARNLTQSEVAQQRFSTSYLGAVERGQIRPSLGALEKLAEKLKVPLADLLRDDETSESMPSHCDPNCVFRVETTAHVAGAAEGLDLNPSVVGARADQGISITCTRLGGAMVSMTGMSREVQLEGCSLWMDMATDPQQPNPGVNLDQGGDK